MEKRAERMGTMTRTMRPTRTPARPTMSTWAAVAAASRRRRRRRDRQGGRRLGGPLGAGAGNIGDARGNVIDNSGKAIDKPGMATAAVAMEMSWRRALHAVYSSFTLFEGCPRRLIPGVPRARNILVIPPH